MNVYVLCISGLGTILKEQSESVMALYRFFSEESEAGTPVPEHVWAVYLDKARVRSSERQR